MSNTLQNDTLSGTSIVQYISPCTVVLDLPNILTIDKKLTVGLPYLYLHGSSINAVQLLDIWDEGNNVFIKIQDLHTANINTLSYSLTDSETYWTWSLVSIAYLQKISIKESGTC